MTAALIIAAGKNGKGRQFDPAKEVGALSAIKRCILTFQKAGVERVVVCGDGEERIEKLVPHMNVTFLRCPSGGEMLNNVKVGLNFLQGKCTAVLITHTDVPLFSVETVRSLLGKEGAVCVPVYQGRAGHPICLSAEQFPQIKVCEMQATYLLWMDWNGLGLPYKELERINHYEAKLFFDEGYIFGAQGEGFERWNLACPTRYIQQALERMKETYAKYVTVQ